jgi:predicted hydrocarbon binding protein
MQFTMLSVLTKNLGREKADQYLRESGLLAGTEFARNALDLKGDFDTFIAELQMKLRELKIGILRIESVNEKTGEIFLTVGEDLDCSGLPITGENVCTYDEGFIAGILSVYTGKEYSVHEIDCWASGDRVCRFKCTQ